MIAESVSHRRRFSFSGCLAITVGIAALLFLIVIVLAILPKHWPFESAAELDRIRASATLAKTRWDSNGITDYDISIRVFIHLGLCWTPLDEDPVTLSVRHGQLVVSEEVKKYNLEEDCHISDLLPPQLFDTIDQDIKQANPNENFLQIGFDPKYGYMTKYFITSNSSGSDMFASYEFSNFQPISSTISISKTN